MNWVVSCTLCGNSYNDMMMILVGTKGTAVVVE